MKNIQQTKNLLIRSGSTHCQLTFTQDSDRWSHHCEFKIDDQSIRTVHSVEGSPDDAWPTSPPFQDLMIESRGEQQVALLVGMSGRSHWSCSVTPIQEADRIGWEFDVACRVKESPVQLGSRYSTEPAQNAVRDPCEISAISGCRLENKLENKDVICESSDQSLPRTACWKYQLVTIVR